MARVVPGIGAPRGVEAARHEARADQEQQRHGDLCHDEARPQASPRRAARRSIFVDDRHEIDARAPQRRNESKDEGAAAGDESREDHDEAIDFHIEEDAARRSEPFGPRGERGNSA